MRRVVNLHNAVLNSLNRFITSFDLGAAQSIRADSNLVAGRIDLAYSVVRVRCLISIIDRLLGVVYANQIFLFSHHSLARVVGRQYSFGCHLHLLQVLGSCRLIVLQI